MEPETIVTEDETSLDSTPEQTPVDQPEVSEPSTDEPSGDDTPQVDTDEEDAPVEDTSSRAQERISELIDRRKAAEQAHQDAIAEANYWKAQATQNQPQYSQPQNFEDMQFAGVTDDGIDPNVFVNDVYSKLSQQIRNEIRAEQTQSHRTTQFEREGVEVSSKPEMQDEFFRDYAVSIAKAKGYTPLEAYEVAKEKFGSYQKKSAAVGKARDVTGKFVREGTATPTAGSSSSPDSGVFTRESIEQLALSNPEEYVKQRDEIERQVAAGLIK